MKPVIISSRQSPLQPSIPFRLWPFERRKVYSYEDEVADAIVLFTPGGSTYKKMPPVSVIPVEATL